MKQYVVEKDWLEEEGMKAFPDLYEKVYLASDVETLLGQILIELDMDDLHEARKILRQAVSADSR